MTFIIFSHFVLSKSGAMNCYRTDEESKHSGFFSSSSSFQLRAMMSALNFVQKNTLIISENFKIKLCVHKLYCIMWFAFVFVLFHKEKDSKYLN